VVVADQHVAESIPTSDNVDVRFLGQLGLKDRLRFTYLGAAREAADWGADLYFSAGELAPLHTGCPMIASFRNPNVFAWGKGQKLLYRQRVRVSALYGLARLTAARADRVMFVSEDSARWIGDSIGLPARKRAVVHHGIDAAAWRPAPGSKDRERSYVLSVSSIYPYKNFVRLIEAYAEMARRHPEAPDLVIIGDDMDPTYSRKIEAARAATGDLADRIDFPGEIPYAEIRRYYQQAALFVFPSFLETFGHPLLEAMASEVPLVASDLPVTREVVADAAFYADPYDSRSLARAMEAALYTPGASDVLVKRGRARVERFTWERSAQRLLNLFQTVLAEKTASLP
jgi:glycosyltransferase involved in cell wall biosynthesis